jgi:hypothetical protein
LSRPKVVSKSRRHSTGARNDINTILKAIKANKEAWKNFKNLSETYKRIRIAFIDGARNRPAEFQKRLNYFIKMTEKNKQFGFGGIEK